MDQPQVQPQRKSRRHPAHQNDPHERLTDPARLADCTLALSIIDGLIAIADDTRSGIYASTQTLFLPWEDSRIVANADLDTTVTLDWLYDDETHSGRGRNTLYVCVPEHPKDAARFSSRRR